MATTLVKWGNSDAIRIPKELLQKAGLKRGDKVELEVNAAGLLQIIPAKDAHRRVIPSRKISADDLFRAYAAGRLDNRDAWPSEDLVSKEQDAWQP